MQTDLASSLFEAVTDSAVLLDKAGRIVNWSQGAATFFGYHKKEVLGRSLNLIYEQNHPFPRIIQEILPQQKKWISETRFIRKNGIKGICKTCVSLVMPNEENKAVALITHFNISTYKDNEKKLQETLSKLENERQALLEMLYSSQLLLIKNHHLREQLEQSLRESELRFHLLAENSTDMISRFTPDGKYLYASPSSKTLLGYTPEELLGRDAYKFQHHDDVGKVRKAFNRRKENLTYHTVIHRMRRRDGEFRYFESNVRIIRDEQNHIAREIQSASRDITEQVLDKKARLRGQQLAHVFRLSTMEEMATGIAHEINQPLAAIVNYTQGSVRYLEGKEHNPDQIIEIMKKAVAQAQRAGEVVHRLKNFFCKGQLFKSPCKINSVIRETVSLIRNDLNNSKTKVEFNFAKDVPMISADKIQLQQVTLNLIQNAIEAMQEIDSRNRRIHIQTKASHDNMIEISVSDSGPGFHKEAIHKVFQPFFTTKAHGRGMGLAICRSIIEAHGGKFSIHPSSNNSPSWIRFTLPIKLGV